MRTRSTWKVATTLTWALLLGVSVAAQGVAEAPIGLRGEGTATLMLGKVWVRWDAAGTTEFQFFLSSSLLTDGVSAELQVGGTSVRLSLGDGEPVTYSGCDPLDRNPYLSVSLPASEFTCPSQMQGWRYLATHTLDAESLAELASERAVLVIHLNPNSPWGEADRADGLLRRTGVVEGRRYFLVPATVQARPATATVRITWSSTVGAHYRIQTRTGFSEEWRTLELIPIATAATMQIEVPTSDDGPQFFRVLHLR